MGWWQGAGRQTTITRVRSQSEQIRDETLQRAHALLASGKDPAKALEFLAHNLTNRSEEHTSELQSLMRISYAVFCLNKKKTNYSMQLKSNINTTNYTRTINTYTQT